VKLPFTLQTSEAVLAVFRRHWLYLWPALPLQVLVALTLPLLALWYVGRAAEVSPLVRNVLGLLSLAWGLYWLTRAYLAYFRYWNDIWVLTNQRLVDSYKAHWFHHRMVTADLVNIQNISANREGLFQTWLNFGDLECETAGERQRFTLAGIPSPSDALAEVDRARDAARAAV
jgi:hypothetical protein